LTNHLATLHIPQKSWTIIDLYCVPFELQPKMKNWILRLLDTYIYTLHECQYMYKHHYISRSAKCSMKPLSNYQDLFYQQSKLDFRVTVTLATLGVLWVRCGFWVSDCCLTTTQQFFKYIMARTIYLDSERFLRSVSVHWFKIYFLMQ